MDGERFDRWARLLGARLSRRRVGGVLAAVGLAGGGMADRARAKKHKKKKKCKGGATKCGKKCVNTQTDALNCGRCGNACGNGVACVDGQCGGGCPGSQIRCGDLCVDPQSNEDHCGGCNRACNGELTCLNGACGCADGGDTRCGTDCVDLQNDDDHCGTCPNACGNGKSCQGGQCVTPTCGANELLCGGRCVPSVGQHPCCSQADCGGPLDGSFNEIVCDETQHQCRCADTNQGICLRTPDGRGLCDQCCPGGIGSLNCHGDLGCNGLNFCTCPAGMSQCSGGSNRCYQSQPNADLTRDDPTVCPVGTNCEDCTNGGTKPYVCCWANTCVDASGEKPGFSGTFGAFCGGCEKCPANKMCCRVGPGGSPACVPPANGGFCPQPGT